MFVELMSVLIFLILLYLAYRISGAGKKEEDVAGFGQVMSEIGFLKKSLEERSEKEKEEKEKREKEIKEEREKMDRKLSDMFRLMLGTQKRGGVGEQHLKNILSVPIKLGIIKTNLQIGTQNVEFAWELGNNKYIPIDSKLPEAEKLIKKYEESEDPDEQKKLKKKIIYIIKKHANEAAKYKNKSNTIDKVIVAVPDVFMDIVPEINADFKKAGVLICGYSYVFFFGYYLSEYYNKMLETGDVGFYQQNIDELLSILRDIESGTIRIDKGVKMIENANKGIKTQVFEAEKHKLRRKKKIPLAVEEK